MRFLGILLFVPMLSFATEKMSFDVRVDAYAQPVSVRAFTDDWQDTLQAGDSAFLQGRVELSTANASRKISLLWRYDYLLDFSPQTAEVYHAYKNQKLLEINKNYPLFIRAKYSESYGVRWLQSFDINNNIKMGLAVNLIKGYKMTDGQLQGNIIFQQQGFKVKDINYMNMDISYYYDEPQLQEEQLEWHPKNPNALGFSIDAELDWKITKKLNFYLILNDIHGRLYWQNIPTTQYHASCQCYKFIHNVEGQLAREDKYTQKLLINGKSQLKYQLSEFYITEIRGVFNKNTVLWQGAVSYKLKNNGQISILSEPQTKALGFELKAKNMYLYYLTDELNTNQAHRLGVGLGFYRQW